MKVLFAGGGTGGHLYPALAVARYLKRHDSDFEALFLGSQNGLETDIVPGAGFQLRTLPGSGFRRSGGLARLQALWNLLRAMHGALSILRQFRPDVVLATGGYASLAGGLSAALLRIPLIVQEQNSIPGFSNRILSAFAQSVHVAFPNCEARFRKPQRVHQSGNPVRQELIEAAGAAPSPAASPPVILVLGGSRGARSINEAVAQAIPIVAGHMPVRWLWQTGTSHFDKLQPDWQHHPGIELFAFLEDMAKAYAAATLVVCRAGAMTLAELAVLGKAAILVPFPGAVDDHQYHNAEAFRVIDAAVLLRDSELSGQRLAREIVDILQRPGRLAQLSENSRRLACPDATRDLAEAISRVATRSLGGVAYVRSG